MSISRLLLLLRLQRSSKGHEKDRDLVHLLNLIWHLSPYMLRKFSLPLSPQGTIHEEQVFDQNLKVEINHTKISLTMHCTA